MTKKVIIIDDSITQLNVLKALFINKGWEVCSVQNAKIGFEMIFDYAPDLIITDAIMPSVGGSQLIKMIREHDKISKIPIIVYSILSEINAKFYIKEELNEYFLRKENNQEELFELAQKITEKFPLEEEYKEEILKIGLENYKKSKEAENKPSNIEFPTNDTPEENITEPPIKKEKLVFNLKNFEDRFQKKFSSITNENKFFPDVFNFIFPYIEYDLAVISLYSFENKEKISYFDIKDLILSPIFKNSISQNHQTKTHIMYKKYAPNLKTILNENEFLSKKSYEIECKDKNIINIEFHSFEKLKWEDDETLNSIENILENFLKANFNKKYSQMNSKEDLGSKYLSFFNKFNSVKNVQDAYFCIIQISNLQEVMQNMHPEDIDLINSKISEKIINCLETNEQIYKSDIDEYCIMIFSKNLTQTQNKLNYIINSIQTTTYENQKFEILVGASTCIFNDDFDILQAEKKAKQALEKATIQEKVIIENE